MFTGSQILKGKFNEHYFFLCIKIYSVIFYKIQLILTAVTIDHGRNTYYVSRAERRTTPSIIPLTE